MAYHLLRFLYVRFHDKEGSERVGHIRFAWSILSFLTIWGRSTLAKGSASILGNSQRYRINSSNVYIRIASHSYLSLVPFSDSQMIPPPSSKQSPWTEEDLLITFHSHIPFSVREHVLFSAPYKAFSPRYNVRRLSRPTSSSVNNTNCPKPFPWRNGRTHLQDQLFEETASLFMNPVKHIYSLTQRKRDRSCTISSFCCQSSSTVVYQHLPDWILHSHWNWSSQSWL